jgi:putative transposase
VNHEVYGPRKVWRQLVREGVRLTRCTVERLVRVAGLRSVVRGTRVVTTRPDASAPSPDDLVQWPCVAERPNERWVADFTHVATWHGFVYVAFVIDVCSQRIVGWRAHTTMRTELVLDALEQALHDRELDGRLVVHSDRGSPYVAMRYTERVADAGAVLAAGRVRGAALPRPSGSARALGSQLTTPPEYPGRFSVRSAGPVKSEFGTSRLASAGSASGAGSARCRW